MREKFAAGFRRGAGVPPGALTLSLGYALFILTAALAFHRVGGYGVETDFYGQYAPQARAIQRLILSGEGRVEIDGLHGPLYPFLLAISGLLAGDIFRGGVLLAVLASGLALYATHRLAPIVLDGEAARLLPLVLLTNETFVRHSYEAGTEMPFLLLSILAVLFALAPRGTVADPVATTPKAPLLLSGAFAALAFLTRQNGVALAAGLLAVLLFLNPRPGGASRRVREAAAFCAGFLVVSAPWFVYCRLQTGRFFVSRSYLVVAGGLLFRGESWDRFANLHADRFGSMSEVLTHDPARLIRSLAINVPDHLWRDLTGLMGAAVGACAALGLVMLATRKVSQIQRAFLVLGLAQFSILLLMFHRVRFSSPLLPYYGFAAAWFIAWLGSRRPVAARRLALAALGLTAALGAWSNARTIGNGPVEVLAIRDRFRAETPAGARAGWRSGLCARKPHLAYYLEMNAVPFPLVEDYENLVALCRERGADYLYYGPAESKTRTPFRSLLDPHEPHPGLEPVVTLVEPPAILYRLSGGAADGGPLLSPPGGRRPAHARRADDCAPPSAAPDAPSTAPRGRRSSAPAFRTAPAFDPPSAAG